MIYSNSDGGARGNPGPGAIGVIIRKNGQVVLRYSKFIGERVTNNTATTITVSVANIGVLAVTGVDIEIMPNENLALNTITKSYLGDLDPGDFTTANFNIMPKMNGEIPIDFKITYTNTLGVSVEETKQAVLKVGETALISAAAVGAFTVDQNMLGYIGLIAIVRVVVFVVYYLIKSKRRRN